MTFKFSIAPRFTIDLIKDFGYLQKGQRLVGCRMHDKPLDGLRYYLEKNNFIVIPLDCFILIERY